ncbi:hypothetical protein [Nonomuraea sp. NPDC050310]|uniref:hypothetical protein n=1 Tax=unclassified Nonomuraea TaxID=2593643 RepID=UPI0033E11807
MSGSLEPQTDARPYRPAKPPPGQFLRRLGEGLASLVLLATRAAALVLVLYAVFTIVPANPANSWYQTVERLAGSLTLGLEGLFQIEDPLWNTLVDYGLAAVVWLIIGSVVASILRRL